MFDKKPLLFFSKSYSLNIRVYSTSQVDHYWKIKKTIKTSMKNILLLFINGIYDEKFHLVIYDENSSRIKNKNIILA
jgi:hypothetical protein